jgi:5-(carboxyamino)imidazole ribonucleotide mutase
MVIIAGAGGAAHLPGMVAAITSIPVIGVPIKTTTLHGIDSLMSIVQMPAGVPVATVAINGAKNAGILASQILGLKFSKIATKVEKYKRGLKYNVIRQAEKLERIGFEKYLAERLQSDTKK